MPQRPGLAELRHRSDPDDDPARDAKQANGGRQRGRPDGRRAIECVDARQVTKQGEQRDCAGEAAKQGRSEAMPREAAERERVACERQCQRRRVGDPQ
jgi:hypothetical protein